MTPIPVPGRATLSAARPDTGRFEYRWAATSLAILMIVASTTRIPVLDQLDEVKLTINAAELVSSVLLILAARRDHRALAIAGMLMCLLLARVTGGLLVASVAYDQPILQSLQEARFGLFIFTIPIFYSLLRTMQDSTLLRYAFSYLFLLTALDVSLLNWLLGEGLLELGARTEHRFFCSVMSPTLSLMVVAVRRHMRGDKRLLSLVLACAGFAAHSILVTTSRTETLLTVGVITFMLCLRWPWVRWLVAGAALAVLAASLVSPDADEGVAGRDFGLAFELAIQGLPHGYGLTTDTVLKSQLNLPDTLFFSDYGLLLYVLRYGVAGILMAVALCLCWVHFVLGTHGLRGRVMLALPMMSYVLFIPMLDYSTLNGALLIALMLLLGNRIFRRQPPLA